MATGGGGFGGQIGFELTDFVFILNNAAAVRTFSQQGSLTLGGNVSIAAGPVGRNAEAAGAASLKGVAAVFAYSKTKGLFAGVSLEGSVLIERRDANEKLYNSRITAKQLLAGGVRPPPSAEPLMRVLNSRVFAGVASQTTDTIYNDIPIYDDNHDNVVWEGRQGQGYNEGVRNNRTGSVASGGDDYEYRDRPQRASTWTDDVYDRQPTGNTTPSRTFSTRANPNETFDNLGSGRFGDDNHSVSNSKPGRPTAPKPKFTPKPTAGSLKPDEAVALYTFDADQPGDLGFKKGEIITITKRTENPTDWWTGKIGDRMGVFPRYEHLSASCCWDKKSSGTDDRAVITSIPHDAHIVSVSVLLVLLLLRNFSAESAGVCSISRPITTSSTSNLPKFYRRAWTLLLRVFWHRDGECRIKIQIITCLSLERPFAKLQDHLNHTIVHLSAHSFPITTTHPPLSFLSNPPASLGQEPPVDSLRSSLFKTLLVDAVDQILLLLLRRCSRVAASLAEGAVLEEYAG